MATKNFMSERAEQNYKLRRENLYKQIEGTKCIQRIMTLLTEEWPKGKTQEYNAKLNGNFKLLNKLLPDARDKSEAITLTQEIVTDESGKQSQHVRVSRSVELLAEFAGGRTSVVPQADGADGSVLPAEVPAQQA